MGQPILVQAWYQQIRHRLARHCRRTPEYDPSDAAFDACKTVDMLLSVIPTEPRTQHAPNNPSIVATTQNPTLFREQKHANARGAHTYSVKLHYTLQVGKS